MVDVSANSEHCRKQPGLFLQGEFYDRKLHSLRRNIICFVYACIRFAQTSQPTWSCNDALEEGLTNQLL